MHLRLLVLCWLSLTLGAAHAVPGDLWKSTKRVDLSVTAPGQVTASPGGELSRLLTGRDYIPGAGAEDGSALLRDLLQGPGPRGEIPITATRKVPWSSLAKGLAKSLPGIATAVAVIEITEALRCAYVPGSGAECDPGQPEELVGLYCTSLFGQTGCADTRQEAAGIVVQKLNETNYGDTSGNPANSVVWSLGGISQQQTATYDKTQTTTYTNNQYPPSTVFLPGQAASTFTNTSELQCPSFMVDGVEVYPVKDADGLCKTGVMQPVSEAQLEDKVEEYGDKTKARDLARAIDAAGYPMEAEVPTVEGPISIPGVTRTETGPNGQPVEVTTRYPVAYTPPGTITPGYTWGEETTTPPPPGSEEGTPPVVVTNPPAEFESCGLPNTPPCKIDERGTPEADPLDPAAIDKAKADAEAALGGLGARPAPGWTWTFALPSSCSVIPLPAFASIGVPDVDICQFQSIFHDLASMLWIGATIFGCIGMVGRTLGNS